MRRPNSAGPVASFLTSSLSRAPSLLLSPLPISSCIRSGSSSLLTLPSLFLSNERMRSTTSSVPRRPGPLNSRRGPSLGSGGCATAPARRSAAVTADASHRLMLRTLFLLCGRGGPSFKRVRELRVVEELRVGQRLQEGDEVGLLGVREIQPAHPRVEVGVRFDLLAVVVDHL